MLRKRRSPSSSDTDENATYVVPDSPESTDIVEPPKVVESPESPVVLESPESPVVLESPESPVVLESPESPVVLESPESPDPRDTGKYDSAEIPRVYQEPENETELCDNLSDDPQDDTEEYEYEEDAIYTESPESPAPVDRGVQPEEIATASISTTIEVTHSVEQHFEFLKKHLKNVDREVLYSLLLSEIDNKRRLETVIEEVLGIRDAADLVRRLRNSLETNEEAEGGNRNEEAAGQMNKYYKQLKEMFPDADCAYLEEECSVLLTEEDCTRFINTVMISGTYPKIQKDNDSEVVVSAQSQSQSESEKCLSHNADDEITSSSIVESIYHKKRKKPTNSASCEDLAIPSTSKGVEHDRKIVEILKQGPSKSQKESGTAPKSKARRVDYGTSTDDWEVEEISSSETKSVEEDKAEKAIKHDNAKGGQRSSDERADDLSGFGSDESELFDPYELPPTTRSGKIRDIRAAIRRKEFLDEWIGEHTAELIRLFPNTDPSYLRAECAKFEGSFEAMNEFVLAKLEKNDMPTRAEYEKRLEMEEIQNRYTTNFSIEDFLKVIPDPWAYFKDRNRNCVAYKLHSLAYLKAKFRRLYTRYITMTLMKNKFNLYLTHKELENYKTAVRVRRRCDFECNNQRPTTINIQFLQEVAFIENEKKIKNYVEAMKEAKRTKFEEAKAAGTLKECQCCFDSEIMLEDTVCCPNDHPVCHQCVIKYVEVEMAEAKCQFPCLAGCGENYALTALQKAIKPEIFSKIIQTSQMEEIKAAGIEDLVHCPFCNYATIMPPEVKVMACLNPECQKESCRLCKEVSHVPLRCEEVEKSEEVRMRTYIENKMTEALIRTCYKCQKKFVKEEGCNKMVCPCGAMMCYICRKPVKNYSHFNGQGGTEYEKCPLYSTNDELHVDLIQRVAEEAKAEMLQANPNMTLKYDPTMVLPERTYELPLPGMNNREAGPARMGVELGRAVPEENILPRGHPQIQLAAEVHPVQEVQAHILPIQPEIIPQVLAQILPEAQIQHEIQIQPQIQLPRIRVQPRIQIPAQFYQHPHYFQREQYNNQPQYQAGAQAPQAAQVQRAAAPQIRRLAAPFAQRVGAPLAQRVGAPLAQRVAPPNPPRAAAPLAQRAAAPNPPRAAAPLAQRAAAPQARSGVGSFMQRR